MSSPCADPSVLKTKNVQSHSLMSTSLRERLKKCGRYHPPGASTCGTPTNIPPATTSVNSPNSLPMKDSGSSAHLKDAYMISKDDIDTPKRRASETFNNTTTGIVKRRKLDYNKGFLGKASNIADQTKEELSPASSTKSVDVSSDVLRNKKHIIQSVSLSSKTEHLQKSDSAMPCLDVEGDDSAMPCLDVEGDDSAMPCLDVEGDDSAMPCRDVEGDDLPSSNNPVDNYIKLKHLKIQMEKEIKDKEEMKRKLTMVKMYRDKNNLTELQTLIDIWRDVSQKALVDLHDLHPPPRPSLTELINHLQIDHELIHYVADDEMFS